jgi:dihydropyrimidinase
MKGFEVKGFTETVLSRGKVVIDNCEYVGKKGDGQFLKRGLYGGMK